MSITSFMTLFGALAMILSWWIVGRRIKRGASAASAQVQYLRGFVLHMGIFCLFTFLPQLVLDSRPDLFPMAMAWGYIIGHVFCYISFTYIILLTFSMVPRLASRQYLAVIFGIAATVGITALTIATMAYGTQPSYDAERSLIIFNVHMLVGALIGVFAVISLLPAAALMIRNGLRYPTARIRSLLLGGGLAVMIIAGPLHDVATTWQVYFAADALSVVSLVLLTSGIIYRFEERIVPARRMTQAQQARAAH